MVFLFSVLLSGCRKRESVLYRGEAANPITDGYREVRPDDNLICGYRTSGQITMEYQLDSSGSPRPVSSGTVAGLHCSTNGGPFVEIDLADSRME